MSEQRQGTQTRRIHRLPARPTARLTALALVLAVSGCSMMPDMPDMPDTPRWVNPFNWFDGDDDLSSLPKVPTTTSTTSSASAKASSGDKAFPKLAAEPAPKSTSSAEGREKMANSLVADRDNARYTDQNLRAGDQRMAAAPPPPKPILVPKTKPPVPTVAKQQLTAVTAVPSAKDTAARPASPSLPPAPMRVASATATATASATDTGGPTNVPSIVQRRGSLPPPPSPIGEASRGAIPQIVQKPGGLAGTPALPKPPALMAPVAPAALPAVAVGAASTGPAPIKLIPPPGARVVAVAAAAPPSVQINLPVGPDQSLLTQTYAASLAAQGSPVVRRPGNVFNAPNAAPIPGQWPTMVPGVVRQAFNASLNGVAQGVESGSVGAFQTSLAPQPQMIASPQMSNKTMRETMRRLPGAPMLIRFRHGSIRLSAAEKRRLGQLVSQAKGSGQTIYVVGHASQRTGDMDYAKHKLVNFGVSLDRANSGAGELRRQGLSPAQIVVQAKGDSEPLYFEFMPNGEAQNRRVELFVR